MDLRHRNGAIAELFAAVCLDSTNPNYSPQTNYDAKEWIT